MDKETNKFHALQLFTDTFSAETVHLTNHAIGIYIRLLCFAWTKNSKPFKTTSAYRICQCKDNDCESQVDSVLEEFFMIGGDDMWIHKRLIKEHKYLTEKYKSRSEAGRKGGLAKSFFASSKTVAPTPTPTPIPTKVRVANFDIFWKAITHKKGSKFLAMKKYDINCSDSDPMDIADRFNRYASTVKDKEFLAHVSTWVNQKRFEDEETNKPEIIPEPIYELEGIKLNVCGKSGEYIELKDDKGNKYQKHKWKGTAIEKV